MSFPLFCTSADVSEEIVYVIVKKVFERLEEFKKLHPDFSSLARETMLQGLSAPFHSGALRYYREAGLIK